MCHRVTSIILKSYMIWFDHISNHIIWHHISYHIIINYFITYYHIISESNHHTTIDYIMNHICSLHVIYHIESNHIISFNKPLNMSFDISLLFIIHIISYIISYLFRSYHIISCISYHIISNHIYIITIFNLNLYSL